VQTTTLDSSVGKNPPFLRFNVALEIVFIDCIDNPNIEQGCREISWGGGGCELWSYQINQQSFEIIHREFTLKNMLMNKSNRCNLC